MPYISFSGLRSPSFPPFAAQAGYRAVIALLLGGVAVGCADSGAEEPPAAARAGPPDAADADPSGRPPAAASEPELALDTIASGLEAPWGMAAAPDGRIFLAERAGRIRVVRDGRLESEPWAVVPVAEPERGSEGGLLGIALAPDFAQREQVFVVGTFRKNGGLVTRIVRYTGRNGKGVNPFTVLDDLPAPRADSGTGRPLHAHLGGALLFGPDGMLYVATGDASQPALATDTISLAGKVLRLRPDGSVPTDNPFPYSPVFALGLRNPQGLAWHPISDRLLATDNGPTELESEELRAGAGGRLAAGPGGEHGSGPEFVGGTGDELDLIRAGGHYGWPHAAGAVGDPRFVEPLREWSSSVGPAGVAIYTGTAFPWQGDVLVASPSGEHIRRVRLETDAGSPVGWRVAEDERLLEGRVGRIRALVMGPDGHLYFATSNRDGRGRPSQGDDRLFRLRRR